MKKPLQATDTTPPTARKLTIKRTPQTARIQKGHPQTQQYKQDKETEEYPADKGTGEMPTRPNKRGRDREST